MSQLRDFFLERNYPVNVVDHALDQVSSLSQEQALQSSEKSRNKNIIPFVVEYNPSLPNIGLNKYWDLLQLSRKDSVKYVHEYKPILAFKRPTSRNLRDFLVHSAFKDKTSHFSQACDRRRCISLKLMFLQAPVLKTRSIYGFLQIVRHKMLFI